ncbi:MAG: 50S ribosomal protein L5 [Patescibacteria group bacterium]
MLNLKEKIIQEAKPLGLKLGVGNVLALPRFKAVVVNVGLGRAVTSNAKPEEVIKKVSDEIIAITGQKPTATAAKKAIASFKTRQGMTIGLKTTLRGRRMYDFLERFVRVALPRTRDFRGLKISSVDANGNLNVGIKDHTIFPEAAADAAHSFSLEFTAVVAGSNQKNSIEFFKALGFPFEK